jgi:hypothetical protein
MVDPIITEDPAAIAVSPVTLSEPIPTSPESGFHEAHVRAISDSTMAESIPMPSTPRTPQHPAIAPVNVLVVDDDQ